MQMVLVPLLAVIRRGVFLCKQKYCGKTFGSYSGTHMEKNYFDLASSHHAMHKPT